MPKSRETQESDMRLERKTVPVRFAHPALDPEAGAKAGPQGQTSEFGKRPSKLCAATGDAARCGHHACCEVAVEGPAPRTWLEVARC